MLWPVINECGDRWPDVDKVFRSMYRAYVRQLQSQTQLLQRSVDTATSTDTDFEGDRDVSDHTFMY